MFKVTYIFYDGGNPKVSFLSDEETLDGAEWNATLHLRLITNSPEYWIRYVEGLSYSIMKGNNAEGALWMRTVNDVKVGG